MSRASLAPGRDQPGGRATVDGLGGRVHLRGGSLERREGIQYPAPVKARLERPAGRAASGGAPSPPALRRGRRPGRLRRFGARNPEASERGGASRARRGAAGGGGPREGARRRRRREGSLSSARSPPRPPERRSRGRTSGRPRRETPSAAGKRYTAFVAEKFIERAPVLGGGGAGEGFFVESVSFDDLRS